MKYKVYKQAKRGCQYEILYDICDDLGNTIVGGLQHTVGNVQLDSKALDSLFESTIYPQISERLKEKEQDVFSREEIEGILKEKGYLEENEKIEDLEVKK